MKEMIRRTFLAAILAGGMSACAPPPPRPVTLVAAPDGPPPSKIQKLLVWLPPTQAGELNVPAAFGSTKRVHVFDFSAFGDELRRQFEGHGVQVLIGTSSGFELDRADEQRKLRAQFRPTHRLEVDMSYRSAESTMAGSARGAAGFLWRLYNGEDAKPVRAGAFSANAQQDYSIASADGLVKRLDEAGYL